MVRNFLTFQAKMRTKAPATDFCMNYKIDDRRGSIIDCAFLVQITLAL